MCAFTACAHRCRGGGVQERQVNEFWLTEHQALAVLLQLRTPQARQARVAVVKAVSVPVPQNGPTIGDSPYKRETIKKLSKSAALRTGRTVHRIQGALRVPYSAAGVYQIPEVHYSDLRDRLIRWIDGDEVPPGSARPQLALVPNPTQTNLLDLMPQR